MTWRPGRAFIFSALLLLALVIAARGSVDLYTETLWYDSLGYASLFWRRLGIAVLVQVAAGVLAGALVFLNLWVVARQVGTVHVRRRYGNLEIAEQVPRRYVTGGILLTAVLAGWWLSGLQFGGGASLPVWAALNSVQWGIADPLFGRDVSFYVFTFPVLELGLDFLLLVTVWALVLVGAGYVLVGSIRLRGNRLELDDGARLHAILLLAVLVLLMGARFWLARYQLVLEGEGIGGALGYTDVRARLPARMVLAVLSVATAVTMAWGAWKRSWIGPAVAGGGLVVAMLVLGVLLPSLVQKLQVEPNEQARETPYIRWNLEFTRRAYGLDEIDRRPFAYQHREIRGWEDVDERVAEIPLWDRDPLLIALNQVQTAYDYYRFLDVDFDRYGPPGNREQVAVAVREFNQSGVPEGSRTWQSLRLNPLYVRGIGAVVARAGTAPGGRPEYWLYDLPSALEGAPADTILADAVRRNPAAPPSLRLTEPSIFFGEGTRDYVILIPGREGAFTGEPGEDYPSGVPLSSFLRVAAFAWRFGDKNLLFSGEVSEDSRIIFRRELRQRVQALAPFILWGDESYPVIHGGRVLWIHEGYTASASFPLATSYSPAQGSWSVRYLRSSVKAVVDAVSGDVTLYAVGEPDPILATYARVFPALFRPQEDMPPGLQSHLRYPALYLHAQAEVLQRYHLTQPEAFYAGQDFWQLPGESPGRGLERPYQADYALMPLPGGSEPEFLLTLPFIARGRQNMTAFLAARSDPPHFGELVLLELPREQLIAGPTQVRTLIEQDPEISAQRTLWSTQGSTVEWGHMLVVPLETSFLYVQPIFLSAEAQSIPELARVVVSDGQNVGMAPGLADALRAMVGTGRGGARAAEEPRAPAPGAEPAAGAWSSRALDLLLQAEERLRAGDYAAFGARLAELRRFLQSLTTTGTP